MKNTLEEGGLKEWTDLMMSEIDTDPLKFCLDATYLTFQNEHADVQNDDGIGDSGKFSNGRCVRKRDGDLPHKGTIWKRRVDGTCAILPEHLLEDFRLHVIHLGRTLKFTKEVEVETKISLWL